MIPGCLLKITCLFAYIKMFIYTYLYIYIYVCVYIIYYNMRKFDKYSPITLLHYHIIFPSVCQLSCFGKIK